MVDHVLVHHRLGARHVGAAFIVDDGLGDLVAHRREGRQTVVNVLDPFALVLGDRPVQHGVGGARGTVSVHALAIIGLDLGLKAVAQGREDEGNRPGRPLPLHQLVFQNAAGPRVGQLLIDEGLDARDAGLILGDGSAIGRSGGRALIQPEIVALALVHRRAADHGRGHGADGRGRAFADIAFQNQVLDGVGRVRRQGEFAAREMVDVGVGEDVAGGVGQVAEREGAHLRAAGIDEPALPEVAEPGVGAPGAVIFDGLRRFRVDDLLAGQDVGIGVGAQHAGPELLRSRAQGRKDGGIDGKLAQDAHDPARVIVGLVDRHLVVIERVAQDFFGQVDVGLGLPGIGGRRRKRGQDGDAADAADQGASGARRSEQSHEF
ncbi:hypothetical protein D3C87_1063090 [compost metagenome]